MLSLIFLQTIPNYVVWLLEDFFGDKYLQNKITESQSLNGLGVAFQVLMPEDSGSNPVAGTILGWFKNPVSSPTKKLMAATKFSDYLGSHHL